MSQITIAGNYDLPDNLQLGDEITITARVRVYSLQHDRIDVSTLELPNLYLPGETRLETVANECHIEVSP